SQRSFPGVETHLLIDILPSGTSCPPKPHPRSLSTSGEGGPREQASSILASLFGYVPPLHSVERGPGGEASEGRPSQRAKTCGRGRVEPPGFIPAPLRG